MRADEKRESEQEQLLKELVEVLTQADMLSGFSVLDIASHILRFHISERQHAIKTRGYIRGSLIPRSIDDALTSINQFGRTDSEVAYLRSRLLKALFEKGFQSDVSAFLHDKLHAQEAPFNGHRMSDSVD